MRDISRHHQATEKAQAQLQRVLQGSGFAGIPEEILSYQPDAVIVDRFTVECQTPNEETRSQFAAFLDQIAW